MLERQGQLPGYTGHIPKFTQNEEFDPMPKKYFHIPNYQGFIPSVKAENLYGKTYSKITETTALGNFIKGKSLPPEERFKSVNKENFTNQLRIPVMPLKPKTYPEPPVDPLTKIPTDTKLNFFGSKVPGSKIYIETQQKKPEKPQKIEEKNEFLSYQQARKLADQERGVN